MLSVRAFAALACFCFIEAAAAEPQTLRFGDMELVYDAARWRADTRDENAVAMQPIGDGARKLDAVVLAKGPARDVEECGALARRQLSASFYDEPTTSAVDIAGIAGVRVLAHTRCRNAMPQGLVVCLPHRGSGYMVVATRPSCRSGANNLFSRIDPVQELLDGVRFVP